jgi:hypothetical protein
LACAAEAFDALGLDGRRSLFDALLLALDGGADDVRIV